MSVSLSLPCHVPQIDSKCFNLGLLLSIVQFTAKHWRSLSQSHCVKPDSDTDGWFWIALVPSSAYTTSLKLGSVQQYHSHHFKAIGIAAARLQCCCQIGSNRPQIIARGDSDYCKHSSFLRKHLVPKCVCLCDQGKWSNLRGFILDLYHPDVKLEQPRLWDQLIFSWWFRAPESEDGKKSMHSSSLS